MPGRVRRPHPDCPAQACHRPQQGGLLAGDVRAVARDDLDVEVDTAPVDVDTEVAGRAGGLDRAFDRGTRAGVLQRT